MRYVIFLLSLGLLCPTIIMSQEKVGKLEEKIDIQPVEKGKQYSVRYQENEWKELLSDFEFHVLRDKGTEYAFSGKLNKEYGKGVYYSRATGQPLFSSEHKYDSYTGWPSFWRPIDEQAIDYYIDRKFGIKRIEVTDSSSGSHLGHVFTDGPAPTGLRYCINSVSLIFVPEGEEPPQIVKDYLQQFVDKS